MPHPASRPGGIPVEAQQITGSIVGTVNDQQGAVISGASIKATNTETALFAERS